MWLRVPFLCVGEVYEKSSESCLGRRILFYTKAHGSGHVELPVYGFLYCIGLIAVIADNIKISLCDRLHIFYIYGASRFPVADDLLGAYFNKLV